VRPALSDPEFLHFEGIGTLEAFNTDGLRTLANTLDAPNMKEKTMRYPGHIETIILLKELGFFDAHPIDIGNQKISPLEVSSKLLFKNWKYSEGEEDLTVMRVVVEGLKGGKHLRYTYGLLDRFDASSKTSSMARTTGYTATAAVRMLARKLLDKKGIITPGMLGQDKTCFEFLINELKKRNIHYKESIEELGGENLSVAPA